MSPAVQHDLQRQLDDLKRRGDQDRREVIRHADLAKERVTELTAEVRMLEIGCCCGQAVECCSCVSALGRIAALLDRRYWHGVVPYA